MMVLLAERPMTVTVMLIAVAVGSLFGWLQTGKREAIWVAIATLALIPIAHVVAERWETDREQIEVLLYELADAVENNQAERAVQVIGDPDIRARAEVELERYRFEMAAINKIREIKVIDGAYPKEAEVQLSVKVDVSDRRGQIRNVRVLRLLILRMALQGDAWKVMDYQHFPITGQPDAASQLSNQPGFQ